MKKNHTRLIKTLVTMQLLIKMKFLIRFNKYGLILNSRNVNKVTKGDSMKVLVSIDGSKHSIKAIDYLIQNASMFSDKGSGLIVLHVEPNVIPPEVTQYISKKNIADWYADQSKAAIKAATAKLDKAKVPYKLVQKIGHVADTILAETKTAKAEMIVMGSHGRSSLMSLVMGSVTSQVLAQSKQPVLIIK
jgi:nucleotide-binding universal stress UspA family protein